MKQLILYLIRKSSIKALKDKTHPPNVHAGHLLMIMAANCLSGLPIEECLLQLGYDLETALRQVDYIAQRERLPLPIVGIPVRLPT